jgi:beta-catenin-like protein 1
VNVDLPHSEDIGHILGIVSSLLTNLASDSTHRIRLLAKFVEGDYEKVDKLLEIREGTRHRLRNTEKELEQEKQVCLIIILVNSKFYSFPTL